MQKIIPGMLNDDIEFFNTESGVKYITNGKVENFINLPFQVLEILRQKISDNAELKNVLENWHPNSEFHQLQQFASCRFGGIDYDPDFKNGILQEGEYFKCPKASTCTGYGIVCQKPKIHKNELSTLEIQLIQLSTSDMTNEVIAEELKIPLGSFHKEKKLLYQKLGVQTKQALTKIAISANII